MQSQIPQYNLSGSRKEQRLIINQNQNAGRRLGTPQVDAGQGHICRPNTGGQKGAHLPCPTRFFGARIRGKSAASASWYFSFVRASVSGRWPAHFHERHDRGVT